MANQTLHVLRIFSVYVQVRDLDRSLSFYRDILGLEVDLNDGTLAVLRSPGDATHTLLLREIGDRALHGMGEVGATRIGFRVAESTELDRAEDLLTRHALKYQRQRNGNVDHIDTRDPDGLHIVLLQADDAYLAAAPQAAIYAYE